MTSCKWNNGLIADKNSDPQNNNSHDRNIVKSSNGSILDTNKGQQNVNITQRDQTLMNQAGNRMVRLESNTSLFQSESHQKKEEVERKKITHKFILPKQVTHKMKTLKSH